MLTILLVGNDQNLLHTRAAVLRKTGCRTICATAKDALSTLLEHSCELVVLCHTVTDEMGVSIVRAVRERYPSVRILQVNANNDWRMRPVCALVDGVSSSKPDALLSRARKMLQRFDVYARLPAHSLTAYIH